MQLNYKLHPFLAVQALLSLMFLLSHSFMVCNNLYLLIIISLNNFNFKPNPNLVVDSMKPKVVLRTIDKQVSLDKHSLYSDLLCIEMNHYMVLL